MISLFTRIKVKQRRRRVFDLITRACAALATYIVLLTICVWYVLGNEELQRSRYIKCNASNLVARSDEGLLGDRLSIESIEGDGIYESRRDMASLYSPRPSWITQSPDGQYSSVGLLNHAMRNDFIGSNAQYCIYYVGSPFRDIAFKVDLRYACASSASRASAFQTVNHIEWVGVNKWYAVLNMLFAIAVSACLFHCGTLLIRRLSSNDKCNLCLVCRYPRIGGIQRCPECGKPN